MNDPIANHFVETYLDRVKQQYAPCEFWLWGSRVYGQPRYDSDLDCVIVSEKFREIKKIRRGFEFIQAIQKFKDRVGFSLNPFCFTPEEFAERKKNP